jgi:flagellar hook-length control protein FliK
LLFKEELQSPKIQHTTQQMVEIKKVKSDSKVIKPKTDSLLSSLISGENTSNALKQEQSLSGILSTTIDTAPILKTQTQQDNSIKDLASMLSGDVVESGTKDTTSEVKADSINVLKADSFEVKLNEAKQMIRYISQDIKQAIDEYKSPFTRVKLQLNPKNLGEVDLTVVQRGKNLHVNLSSNNVAINTLSANVNELRVQLNNSGINNATLNFNNNSQNSHQGQHKPRDEYRYFENEEKNEELTDSLEIIVPHYA